MTELSQLKAEIAELRRILATALCWIVQSANSPLSIDNAQELLAMLEESKTAGKA